MEQIYYTQCPIGYGLGASNGFQIKRVSPGYPLSSDFRHLGLRAFPSGGRALAPAALRYRRVAGRAEVALMTPRALEYETERGLWGRPGGHFAHGLILNESELAAIDDWPAGLRDRPFWRKSDPEPSRGRPPDPVDLGAPVPTGFEPIIAIVSGLDREWLAKLLTALATVAREGRTLFLIDEPDRLGPMIAALTFLFPPPLRAELTFSTYHDRPEELPGYRLHGTTHAARPNRPVLLTQGIIADARASTIEPRVEPAHWSIAVVDWLLSGDAVARDDFARHVAKSDCPDRWDGDRLDHLVDFGRSTRSEPGSDDWSRTLELIQWAASANLTDDWNEGRAALWGRAVGQSPNPESTAFAFAEAAPGDAERLDFLLAIRRQVPRALWDLIRRRLGSAYPAMSKLLMLPDAIESGNHERLRSIAESNVLSDVAFLELVKAEAGDRPIAPLAEGLESFFDRVEAFGWALGQADRAGAWLYPFLRRHLATPEADRRFQAHLDGCPAELRPTLTRVFLEVASDEGLPENVFIEAVEHRLLSLPEADRPENGEWSGRYLDRSPSDYELVRRMYGRGPTGLAVRTWLKAAAQTGLMGIEHRERLQRLDAIARTLNRNDPGPIESIDLPKIPGPDRGPLLARWLAQGRPDPTALLDRCAEGWSESLADDSPDLESLAHAIAESPILSPFEANPETWFQRLAHIRRHLDPSTLESTAFGPDGFIARVIAETTSGEEKSREQWAILEYLLNNDAGWPTIARSFGVDLQAVDPTDAPRVVEAWDRAVYKGSPARFWEVALNACDGPRLASVVQARAADLRTLGRLSWWDHKSYPGARDDLRDAFARLIPMRPLKENALPEVELWMKFSAKVPMSISYKETSISPLGLARWTCLVKLTREVFAKDLSDIDRRFHIKAWCGQLPLAEIDEDDRYGLLAWVILRLDDPSALDVNPVGKWLVKSGLIELDRITNWSDELRGLTEVSDAIIRERRGLAEMLRKEMRLVIQDDLEIEGRKIPAEPSSK